MVTQALAEPRTVRILPRGNWRDDSGEVVMPAVAGLLARRRAEYPADLPAARQLLGVGLAPRDTSLDEAELGSHAVPDAI